MLTLIAESKTMSEAVRDITPDEAARHSPVFDADAGEIMSSLVGMTAVEIAQRFGVGRKVAETMCACAYDFPNKTTGLTALRDAFTGVVFRSLDVASLNADSCQRAVAGVRIVSSAYGWLRPDDVVKPYRADYTMPLSPVDGKALYTFWRPKVTSAIVRELRDGAHDEIINLLPGDAAKCVDWTEVGRHARIWTPEFKRQDGPVLKTPESGRLKRLRGLLLRHILIVGISSSDGIRGIDSPDFVYCQDDTSSSGRILMITD